MFKLSGTLCNLDRPMQWTNEPTYHIAVYCTKRRRKKKKKKKKKHRKFVKKQPKCNNQRGKIEKWLV